LIGAMVGFALRLFLALFSDVVSRVLWGNPDLTAITPPVGVATISPGSLIGTWAFFSYPTHDLTFVGHLLLSGGWAAALVGAGGLAYLLRRRGGGVTDL